MLRGAAIAAPALLVLALGAVACKPSSLTPFTDWRQTESEAGVNGLWLGRTISSSGEAGTLEFAIASDEIADFSLIHNTPECVGYRFFSVDTTVPVEGDTFEVELFLETQGRFVIQGQFTSSDTASGTYFFEGTSATGSCPTSDSGTFIAAKFQ